MSAVSWNLQLSVREGQSDALRALIPEMVDHTRAETGCQAYEWFLSTDGGTLHIYERYVDSGAVLAHLGNFGAKFADRFLGCLEPTSLTVYGDPSADARAGLDSFGAVYFSKAGGFRR